MRGRVGVAIAVAATLAGVGGPAGAQTGQQVETARRLVSGLQQAVTSARLRQTVAGLSAPLEYETRLGPVNPAVHSDPRLMDVAGVRLGMTPAEAEAALLRAGFVRPRNDRSSQVSYDSQVRTAWVTRWGAAPSPDLKVDETMHASKGAEEVTVTFIALPEGPRVDHVDYRGDERAVTAGQFGEQLEAKYGPPSSGGAEPMRWCTLRAPECEDPRSADYPVLQGNPGNRTLWLTGADADRKTALAARFEADAASRQPTQARASF